MTLKSPPQSQFVYNAEVALGKSYRVHLHIPRALSILSPSHSSLMLAYYPFCFWKYANVIHPLCCHRLPDFLAGVLRKKQKL